MRGYNIGWQTYFWRWDIGAGICLAKAEEVTSLEENIGEDISKEGRTKEKTSPWRKDKMKTLEGRHRGVHLPGGTLHSLHLTY